MRSVIWFDNGAPDQVHGTQMSEFLVADNFAIGATADITNIRFWSIQSDPNDYTGSVYWGIYSNAGGNPGGVLHSDVTPVGAFATGGVTGFGYAEYVFDVPVAFTHQIDITGGNSGSPVMNARGELVGVVFDGNYEAMITATGSMMPISNARSLWTSDTCSL